MRMATSGGGNHRNGTYRSSLKVDKPLALNSNSKSSVKSKPLSSSGPRRNSTGSLGAATGAAKDDAGGEFVVGFAVFAEFMSLKFLNLVIGILGYPFSCFYWYRWLFLFV